jgi:hypothetical protein
MKTLSANGFGIGEVIMNKRIKQFAEQSLMDYELLPEISREPVWIATDDDLEKFAEFIVRKCADITNGLSKLYPRTDVAFDVGYTMGTERATKEIKEHFGVK